MHDLMPETAYKDHRISVAPWMLVGGPEKDPKVDDIFEDLSPTVEQLNKELEKEKDEKWNHVATIAANVKVITQLREEIAQQQTVAAGDLAAAVAALEEKQYQVLIELNKKHAALVAALEHKNGIAIVDQQAESGSTTSGDHESLSQLPIVAAGSAEQVRLWILGVQNLLVKAATATAENTTYVLNQLSDGTTAVLVANSKVAIPMRKTAGVQFKTAARLVGALSMAT